MLVGLRRRRRSSTRGATPSPPTRRRGLWFTRALPPRAPRRRPYRTRPYRRPYQKHVRGAEHVATQHSEPSAGNVTHDARSGHPSVYNVFEFCAGRPFSCQYFDFTNSIGSGRGRVGRPPPNRVRSLSFAWASPSATLLLGSVAMPEQAVATIADKVPGEVAIAEATLIADRVIGETKSSTESLKVCHDAPVSSISEKPCARAMCALRRASSTGTRACGMNAGCTIRRTRAKVMLRTHLSVDPRPPSSVGSHRSWWRRRRRWKRTTLSSRKPLPR